MTSQMIIRIDSELKERFSTLAKTEGKPASEVVRELMAQYVRTRDIGGYIDDLWGRIGNDLREKGVNPTAIKDVIRKTRAEN